MVLSRVVSSRVGLSRVVSSRVVLSRVVLSRTALHRVCAHDPPRTSFRILQSPHGPGAAVGHFGIQFHVKIPSNCKNLLTNVIFKLVASEMNVLSSKIRFVVWPTFGLKTVVEQLFVEITCGCIRSPKGCPVILAVLHDGRCPI